MPYVNLEIHLLRTFVVAVEAGAFVRAANLVGRTPSAVSLQIDRLEECVGQPIFQRDGRGFALTSAGEQLLSYARRMLALNDETVCAMQKAQQAQTVRLGLPEDFARCWLPAVLVQFTEVMPNVTIEVRTHTSANLLAAMQRGDLDLAVVFGNQDCKGAQVLAELPTVWVGPPEMSTYKPDGPIPLILFSPPCLMRTLALESLERARLAWRVALISPGLAGQWAAVKAGIGISLRVHAFVPSDLAVLGYANGLPSLPNSVLTLHERTNSGVPSRVLREILIEQMSKEPCWRDRSQPIKNG
jgi:DNA-binding transcriptional LysR family regulator